MAEAEKKKMTTKKKRLLIAAAAAAVLLLVCRLVLSQMNFFSDLAKEKAVSLARSEMGVDLALSSIEGNPVTGFNASDVVISRSGDAVVSAKNVGINISLPSVLTGSPSLSTLVLDSASGDLQKMIDVLPKTKKSDEPTDIPIDTVVVKDSTIITEWGDLYVEDAAVDIINSQSYEFEFAGAAAGHKLSASGAAAKKEGVWGADNLKLNLEGGTAEVSGALFPSADVTLSCDKLNLSLVSDIVPELEKYGVRGILSANATLKSVGKGYESEGSGNLHNALVNGIPLEDVATKWSIRPESFFVEVGKGKVFNSTLHGSLTLKKLSNDRYLSLNAEVKDLKFADWTPQFEKETGGRSLFISGSVSSLSADVEGPLNALKGRVELKPSDIAYGEIDLKDLQGTAVFKGRPAGDINFTAKSGGKPVSLNGVVSFGTKVPSNFTFRSDGISIEKIFKSITGEKKSPAKGTVALNGECKGLFGSWVVTANASSPMIETEKYGKFSSAAVTASYGVKDKKVTISRSSAYWNDALLSAKGEASLDPASNKIAVEGSYANLDAKVLYAFLPILEKLNVEGIASGTLSVGGTTKSPIVKANVTAGAGRFLDARFGNLNMAIDWSGRNVRLSPIKVSANGGSGVLDCAITIPETPLNGKRGPTVWKLTGDISNVDVSLIDGLIGKNTNLKGPVTGKVTVGDTGNGLTWSFDSANGDITWDKYRAKEIKGNLNGSTREINVKNLSGTFLNGSVNASGSIVLPETGASSDSTKLNLAVTVKKLNLYELLRKYIPAVRSTQGLVETSMKVTGTFGEPNFEGKGRIAPLRYRGWMLPMIDVQFRGTPEEIVVNDAKALLRNGTLKGYSRFYKTDGEWCANFNLIGDRLDLRQLGAYLPEEFRSRFGGVANFSMKGDGKISNITASGEFSAPWMRVKGIKFENVKAPFFVANNYMMMEDLNATTNKGTLTGGLGYNLHSSEWGGNLTVMSADLKTLVKQFAPKLQGEVSGTGDLTIRGIGMTGRESTAYAGGAMILRNGEITSFDVLEAAKKFTGGKPLRFKTVQSTFTYDGGDLTILPGSQATAPEGDPVYQYAMLDGYITAKEDIKLFAMGKVNIRALNSLIGAFQGLISAGMDYSAGEIDKGEVLQEVLGGLLSGYSKSEFRFVTMNIGGTVSSPDFYNVEVQRGPRQRSGKDLIPTSNSDPTKRNLAIDGETTFKFKFEIPIGPGHKTKTDIKGDALGQTLGNIISNFDFGL